MVNKVAKKIKIDDVIDAATEFFSQDEKAFRKMFSTEFKKSVNWLKKNARRVDKDELQDLRKLLTRLGLKWTIKNNIFELTYQGADILATIERKKVRDLLKELDELGRRSPAELKKRLKELARPSKARKAAYNDFVKLFSNAELDKLWKHLDGEIDYTMTVNSFGKPIILKKSGKGAHNYQQVFEGKIRIKGETEPLILLDDQPFIARIQMYDSTNPQSFVNKANSTLVYKGKQTRDASSFFPINWSVRRQKEEIAIAFKSKSLKVQMRDKNNIFVEMFQGKSTTGWPIQFVYNDKILKSTIPII